KRLGLPCQKSPSTNNTSFRFGNTKSGRPDSLLPRRQPLILYRRMTRTRRNSVVRLPFDRILAIFQDRTSGEKQSAIHFFPTAVPTGSAARILPNSCESKFMSSVLDMQSSSDTPP